MRVQSDRNLRPYGHLGFHPTSIGLMLGDGANRMWRVERYVELWVLLHTTAMLTSEGDDRIHLVCCCKQGIHRSVFWKLVQSFITKAFGMSVDYENVCQWEREKRRCRWGNPRNGCSVNTIRCLCFARGSQRVQDRFQFRRCVKRAQ